jgi:hypothetical protein
MENKRLEELGIHRGRCGRVETAAQSIDVLVMSAMLALLYRRVWPTFSPGFSEGVGRSVRWSLGFFVSALGTMPIRSVCLDCAS